MKKINQLFKKQIDERQELEMLKAERRAYWVTFFLLFISIIVQEAIYGASKNQTAGETIVLIISALVLTGGCIRKGLWCYQNKKVPGIKSYILYSLAGSLAGIIIGLNTSSKIEGISVMDRVLIIAFISGSIFIFCFFTFLIAGSIAKYKEKELEKKATEDEDE